MTPCCIIRSLHAASLLGVDPPDCVYVGDAFTDLVAARQAGMRCWIARYGYLGIDDNPDSWDAERVLDAPADILEILRRI